MTRTLTPSAPSPDTGNTGGAGSGGNAGNAGNAASAGKRPADRLLSLASLGVAVGVLLTMLPLRSVFTDWNWLLASVACALPYIGIVSWARLRGQGQLWPVILGLAVSFLLLAWVFLPQHLLLGVLPTPSSLADVNHLLDQAHESMQADHAPVASTTALRLLTAASTVLLVALTDVLGLLWRKPLLASAPLLEVLAVASATSSKAAAPIWFVAAAVGFLLILFAGTRLQDRDWGPSVDGSAGRLGGARWMAVTAIVAALIVPLALPSVSGNVLARATHHTGDGSGGGSGRIELNNTADLSGSLRRGTAVPLLKVNINGFDRPFYVRQVVLDQFTRLGWVQSAPDVGTSVPVDDGAFPAQPDQLANGNNGRRRTYHASFTILNLGGTTLPLLADPTSLRRVAGGEWDATTASVFGVNLKSQGTYEEDVSQPDPSAQDLRDAPPFTTTNDTLLDERYISKSGIAAQATRLAESITAGAQSDYDKAKAISDYFTDPKNGFVYSVNTAPVVDNDALQSFLTNKRGYCQQFAAAAAVLMRAAGVPSRVVLGYTHQPADSHGNFTVTTADAHAWVEVYFAGQGWVPFDPTPLGGPDANRAVVPLYEQHTTAAPSSSASATAGATSTAAPRARPQTSDQAVGEAGTSTSSNGLPWSTIGVIALVLIALLLALLAPQLLRQRQRRRRLRLARSTGDPEALWQELAATALDQGALWPDTVTVGQVPAWLGRHGVDERGTATATAIAAQVERGRYSSTGGTVPVDVVAGLSEAMRRWSRRAERRQRLLNWWLPRSLVRREQGRRR